MATLTIKEHSQLEEVQTTVSQAKQILQRNTMLLKRLQDFYENREEYRHGGRDCACSGAIPCSCAMSHIGCPHCGGSCSGCAWEVLGDDQYGSYCIYQTFGGVAYIDVNNEDNVFHIKYGALGEGVEIYMEGRGDLDNQYSRCRTFLLGHIEWAESVIAMGGTDVQA